MAISLERIDSVPIAHQDGLDPQFFLWLGTLIDTLNELIGDLETALNFLTAPNFTQVEIQSMNTAGDLSNGVLLYDTTNNWYVGRENGVLRRFTTASYP